MYIQDAFIGRCKDGVTGKKIHSKNRIHQSKKRMVENENSLENQRGSAKVANTMRQKKGMYASGSKNIAETASNGRQPWDGRPALMMADQKGKKMEKYNMPRWALITMYDRNTQDDHKSKASIEAMFSNPVQVEECYSPYNPEVKRYLLPIEMLERFEEFYNFVQDLNEEYGDHAIFHLKDGDFTVDEENRFRNILDIWTDTKIK